MSAVRPILFSGPMIRAILDGRKCQTRRLLKPQPMTHHWRHFKSYSLTAQRLYDTNGSFVNFRHALSEAHGQETVSDIQCEKIRIAYGKPGDLLWVRETAAALRSHDSKQCIRYEADQSWVPTDKELAWAKMHVYRDRSGANVNSIHMPRWASRLTLELTHVRVQQLQDISEADAQAEGIARLRNGQWHWTNHEQTDFEQHGYHTASGAYDALWGVINGAQSWPSNPWVVALTFCVHRLNVDTFLKQMPADRRDVAWVPA